MEYKSPSVPASDSASSSSRVTASEDAFTNLDDRGSSVPISLLHNRYFAEHVDNRFNESSKQQLRDVALKNPSNPRPDASDDSDLLSRLRVYEPIFPHEFSPSEGSLFRQDYQQSVSVSFEENSSYWSGNSPRKMRVRSLLATSAPTGETGMNISGHSGWRSIPSQEETDSDPDYPKTSISTLLSGLSNPVKKSMAYMFLSVSIQLLIDKLTSPIFTAITQILGELQKVHHKKSISSYQGKEKEKEKAFISSQNIKETQERLKRLDWGLLKIQSMLTNAQNPQVSMDAGTNWQNQLINLACNLEDVVDNIVFRVLRINKQQQSKAEYEMGNIVLRIKLNQLSEDEKNEVHNIILNSETQYTLNDISEKLDTLAEQITVQVKRQIIEKKPLNNLILNGRSRDGEKKNIELSPLKRGGKKVFNLDPKVSTVGFQMTRSHLHDEEAVKPKYDPRYGLLKSIDVERHTSGVNIEKQTSGVAISETNQRFCSLPDHLMRCFLYTSLFYTNYDFEKETLVQLWMAAGFIQHDQMMRVEDIGCQYFESLLSQSFFQESFLDHSKGQSRYKMHDDFYNIIQESSLDVYASVVDGKSTDISEMALHPSLLCENVDQMILDTIYKCKRLRTLILLCDYHCHIKEVPYDLFLNLRSLRVLVLNRTHVMELPSSIGYLKDLHYLDLSETPIKKLPESVSNLHNLQVLKLRDCLNLVELPNEMKNLINLIHLDLDVVRQFSSMPVRMGNLTNLETLSAFIVGRESGFQIGELKNMINLRGSICIVNLENVMNVEEAKEAALNEKQHLNKLELRWNELQDAVEEVLNGLKPHTSLTELSVVCYGGLTFPDWFGDSSFSNLVTISLYNCSECKLLPPLGQLPFLKSLYIGEMDAIERIDHQFCGNAMVKGFPKLETLEFDGMPSLEEWTGIEVSEMPFLQKLTIVYCPKLIALPKLSCLKSLQHLEISLCSELSSFPEKGLPMSLQSLIITDCPVLKEQCLMEEDGWHKIAGSAAIWIDYEQIYGT